MKAQRLRVTFTRGDSLRYISHLDLMRFWERALRRAAVAVSYSEGFTAHPQIQLGAPLPVGTTGLAELMDVFLEQPVAAEVFAERIRRQLPPGVTVAAVREVPLGLPSMQSQLRSAEYEATLATDVTPAAARTAVGAFLARESVPWEQQRDKEVRRYDLRPLVESLRVVDGAGGGVRLVMRLDARPGATGRPDQVVAALGFGTPVAVCRTRLILDGDAPEPGDGNQGARSETAAPESGEAAGCD